MFLRLFFSSILFLFLENTALALTFPLPPAGDNVVGQIRYVEAMPGDNFSRLGRRYDVGYYELVEANPKIDPEHVESGSVIVVPTKFILPAAPYTGIVVNLSELRLYYYPPNTQTVVTMPVGVGTEGWGTPVGSTRVIAKVKDPTWVVPKSILDDRAKEGVTLPKSIPPGPENPMGGFALHLALQGYRIHGAKQSDTEGIGRRSSHGCIRLFNEDIEYLYELVEKGTPVRIINESTKVGWLRGNLYLESHLPIDDQNTSAFHDTTPITHLVKAEATKRSASTDVDWRLVDDVVVAKNGIPEIIGVVARH